MATASDDEITLHLVHVVSSHPNLRHIFCEVDSSDLLRSMEHDLPSMVSAAPRLQRFSLRLRLQYEREVDSIGEARYWHALLAAAAASRCQVDVVILYRMGLPRRLVPILTSLFEGTDVSLCSVARGVRLI